MSDLRSEIEREVRNTLGAMLRVTADHRVPALVDLVLDHRAQEAGEAFVTNINAEQIRRMRVDGLRAMKRG